MVTYGISNAFLGSSLTLKFSLNLVKLIKNTNNTWPITTCSSKSRWNWSLNTRLDTRLFVMPFTIPRAVMTSLH